MVGFPKARLWVPIERLFPLENFCAWLSNGGHRPALFFQLPRWGCSFLPASGRFRP